MKLMISSTVFDELVQSDISGTIIRLFLYFVLLDYCLTDVDHLFT